MGSDFPKHLEWSIKTFSDLRNDEVKALLARSLSEMLRIDAETSSLADHADSTLKHLQNMIESTDSPKVFSVAVDALVLLADSYPDVFADHFIDTVDILIGWYMHMENGKLKDFALETLEKFSDYWQANSFSVTLLGQFVDDVVNYGKSLESPSEDPADDRSESPESSINSITSIINVFDAVIKSLGDVHSINSSKSVSSTFLSDSFKKLLKTFLISIKIKIDEDLVLAGNECIYLYLEKLRGNVSSGASVLYEIVEVELENTATMSDKIVLSLLDVIRKIIKEISSNLSATFIKTIIGPNSHISDLKNSQNVQIQADVVSVYQSLLNLKNIPLLQDVYRYVLEDMEKAFKTLLPDVEILSQNSSLRSYTILEAEFEIVFYLQCLSDIANASNSIIGMWALQPSILELLATKMIPYDQNLARNYPTIQYSIIYLLYSHCKKNNHFIASSDLIGFGQQRQNMCDILRISSIQIGDTSSTSPTCGHFAVILGLFKKLFRSTLPTDTSILLLHWTSDIFNQLTKSYMTIFHLNLLVDLVIDCINTGFTTNERILKRTIKNIEILILNRSIRSNNYIMNKLAELCMLHIDNNNVDMRKMFAFIFTYVPLDLTLDLIVSHNAKCERYKSKQYTLSLTNIKCSQKEHLMRDTYGQMSTEEFKTFMNYLLLGSTYHDGWLKDSFLNCWPVQNSKNDNVHLEFFRHCASNFSSVLSKWATWESAQLCTMLKLRTPLGKPQETFKSIESSIKQIARELTSNDTSNQNKISETKLDKLKRSRMLIEFFESLEKSMQNAVDGCAVVLLPMDKPVRTFFHTNSLTCQEWVNRVRPAVILISLHTGHAAAAVRHTQSLLYLPTIANSTVTLTSDLLAHCVSLTRGLLRLKEPEVIYGIYTWMKQVYGRKLAWLKCAAEQCSLKFESAITSYMALLALNDSSEENKLHDCETKFIIDQIIECHKSIHSWHNVILWKNEKCTSEDDERIWNYDFKSFECYNKFQNNEILYETELCDWDVLSFNSDDCHDNNTARLFDRVENTLKNVALKVMFIQDYLENDSENISSCIEFIENNLYELSRNQPCEFLPDIHILHHAVSNLKSIAIDRNSQINPFFTSPEKTLKNYDPSTLCKIMWWCDYFFKLSASEVDISCMESIRLDLIKSSRKNANYNLSKRELLKFFSFFDAGTSINRLEDICEFFLRSINSYDVNIWSPNNIVAVMETSKLLYVDENTREMAMNLCASASLGVSQRLALEEHTYEFREKGTRMLLTLSKWVQNENDKLLTNNLNSPLTKLVTALPEIGLVNNNISAHVIPISDSAVGKLLQFSVNQCPGFAKAWFTFGSWCFRWGMKMVEYSSTTGRQLTENDKIQIKSMMLQSSQEDFEAVCEILSKTRAGCDDDDIDWSEINTSDMIENQLRSVPSLRNAYSENLVLFVDIWRQAQKRVFSYYELSADAYFKFLDLSSSSDTVNHNGECAIVTATLRLLKLIVKHAMELQNVLETGLANTPTQPWKVIIPQLFSRLNHPENYVRRRVSELLCRLAEDAPHLITFPAVVGAVENKRNDFTDFSFIRSVFLESDDKDLENMDSIEENDIEDSGDDYLNSCFMDMVDTLANQAPETILQVQLLVKELHRINLLWDELWLRTLAQHNSNINKRLIQLNTEIQKVNNNSSLQAEDKTKLISEKYHIFMKPILFILEQLADITNATPETPYEKSFQDKFIEPINDMLDKLRNPSNPEKPDFWTPIKQLQTKLQQKSNKRSPYTLKMSDISPVLGNMIDTVISMPGVLTSLKVRITIRYIDNNVAILPSKTKPKKLIFHGSDGKIYTYLFKGLEDLHLDERIMQFLSITNIMMAQDKEDNTNQTYRARHYSVIPLGPRSGLISWVENLTPLFALYKRWQQRESITVSVKSNTNKPAVVLRPSELFYNKLIPLLNAAGVSMQNRKKWPISILKQVLVELMSETPKDLLAKELWSSSITPGHWWHTVRRYSFSVAVMSTIGYIIGLGDRHLDNVLIDLNTGEVVHIDYNVCFEDGKTLRVPEKVPFRMTPNLERCLGVTGVEGIFRMACEHVLKTMKRGRKTLLTLLEAFVYDPLVEWSNEAGAGTAAGAGAPVLLGKASALRSAAVERRCGLDLLAVRLQEVCHAWGENRDEIQKQLPVLRQQAAAWSEQQKTLVAAESQLQQYHRQLALVKELEALGADITEHPLYTTARRYSSYKKMKEALEDSAKNLLELHEDCGNKIDSYTNALETIKGPQLAQWIQELNFPIDHDGHNVFYLIRDFLLNAGQSSMITQCEQTEVELGQCARQQTHLIKNCLELLSQFATIAQYLPQSFIEKHRVFMYRKWTAILLETESLDVCNEVIHDIHNSMAPESSNNASLQQMTTFSYQLQNLNNAANIKFNKFYERLKAEGGPDALPKAEKCYLDAINSISNFISQGGGKEKAIECIIIRTLSTLNRRFLLLENSAHSAGECLVDLMSLEGEWFFEDMSVISFLVTELISFIPAMHDSSTLNDDRITKAFECLNACKSVFSDLKELLSNFQSIILPEAVKKIQAEEPSVLMMINELNNVVINTDIPLNELIAQLELNIRYVVMDMDTPTNTLAIAADLRNRYKNLVKLGKEAPNSSTPNPDVTSNTGHMLLMGTDGLFAQLGARGVAILDTLTMLNIPHLWKKVDQITEANDLAISLNNEQLRLILDEIFFVKRIQAITEFFNMCLQMSLAFKGVGSVVVYDDDRLSKPIKRFMADYVGRQFLGIQTQTLAVTICLLIQRCGVNVNKEIEQRHIGMTWKVNLYELCEISVACCLNAGLFTPPALQQANSLIANLEMVFRRREAINKLEGYTQLQQACVTRLRLQLSAHIWLRGEGRGLNGGPTPGAELRRGAQQLAAQRPHLMAALEKHRTLVSSAEQRLKWASGVNPALNDVMAAFECAVNIREDRLNVECGLATAIGLTCSALGNLTLGGNAPGSWTGGRELSNLASRRMSALALVARAPSAPTPLHESLLQLLQPEENIDIKWVCDISALISEKILQLQKSLSESKTDLSSNEEKLKKAVIQLTNLKRTHENIVLDTKTLLKVFAKTQDNIGTKAFDYLTKHKNFITDLNELIEALNVVNISDKTMYDESISNIESQIPSIFDELLSFELAIKEDDSGNPKRRGTLVRQMAGVWNSPAKQTPPPKGRSQQVNAYAVSVWKRVRLKLEGRDPDPARKHSNQEQVDYIIKEAMSLDNLCLLYEGWTPWV